MHPLSKGQVWALAANTSGSWKIGTCAWARESDRVTNSICDKEHRASGRYRQGCRDVENI